jgi:hypothetical protein
MYTNYPLLFPYLQTRFIRSNHPDNSASESNDGRTSNIANINITSIINIMISHHTVVFLLCTLGLLLEMWGQRTCNQGDGRADLFRMTEWNLPELLDPTTVRTWDSSRPGQVEPLQAPDTTQTSPVHPLIWEEHRVPMQHPELKKVCWIDQLIMEQAGNLTFALLRQMIRQRAEEIRNSSQPTTQPFC